MGHRVTVPAGGTVELRLRLRPARTAPASGPPVVRSGTPSDPDDVLGGDFDRVMALRRRRPMSSTPS